MLRIQISIPDPEFRVAKIPEPGSKSTSKNFSILTLLTVSKLSEKLSGMFIPDPDFFPSKIRIRNTGCTNSSAFSGHLQPAGPAGSEVGLHLGSPQLGAGQPHGARVQAALSCSPFSLLALRGAGPQVSFHYNITSQRYCLTTTRWFGPISAWDPCPKKGYSDGFWLFFCSNL